jgi:predicted SAM-dependent methyltransferase/ribosomal protein S27AE
MRSEVMKLKILVKKVVKAVLPYGVLVMYRRNKEKRAMNYCPICGTASFFTPFGISPRQKALCGSCGSLERHRLLWLFFQKRTNLFKKETKKILHIAAESCFESRFKTAFGENYITADLYNPSAMVKLDITSIPYSDESFDIIICNHVLEHVQDDRKAMGELYRILKKNGWAVLLVPIFNRDKTYEDFSITTDAGRLEAFGQEDHVRKYGRDYIDRLKSVGFKVTVTKAEALATANEIKKMSLLENSNIFYCTK